ncbi:MAG: Glu-tRNA(Gln) amidotransferase subunit GatE [Thermoplasmata archaeon]
MKAGLEVHQQLSTGKLFCRCPCELTETTTGTFTRRLVASGGEDRAIDPAARAQAARGLAYRYETCPPSCLVEMDEEPPHAVDASALDTALIVARLLGARIVDEIEVMRKIVVDGSNTTGFQRTALIAVGGYIEVGGRRIGIESVCLEEDAARKVGEGDGELTYRLDRLGIPLLEVATAPDIESGREARAVAEEIGALLRATGRVRRGIGSIREDLNVSAEGGRRAEIKGVQELRWIEPYVAAEIERQTTLLLVRDRLRAQGARAPSGTPTDLTSLFAHLTTGPLASRRDRPVVVLADRLPGFSGLLRSPAGSDARLGRELAERARAVGLKGLLHSDELPGYGVGEGEVAAVRAALGLEERDAFILIADGNRDRAEHALREVAERAAAALEGIPGETRDPLPEGRSRYSRPLAGRHRMYPETDVPPILISAGDLARIDAMLPERPAQLRDRLERKYGLPTEVVGQLVAGGESARFEELARRGRGASTTARLLTQDLPAVEGLVGGSYVEPDLDSLDELLRRSEEGAYAKEGIPTVLAELARGASSAAEAVARSGLRGMAPAELDRIVAEVLQENAAMIASRGAAAFQPLMGDVMKKVRGRADGEEVARRLRSAIERAVETASR